MTNREKFTEELEALIRKYLLGDESHTPSFILAQYLTSCLSMFNLSVTTRDKWRDQE